MDNGNDDSKKLEVALQFRNLADANFLEQKLGDAFFYYLNCLKIYPNWKADLKETFFIVLSELNCLLYRVSMSCKNGSVMQTELSQVVGARRLSRVKTT